VLPSSTLFMADYHPLCMHSISRVENSDEVCPRPVCCTGWETKTEEVAEIFEACLAQVISQK
jgi:hypothetical protein